MHHTNIYPPYFKLQWNPIRESRGTSPLSRRSDPIDWSDVVWPSSLNMDLYVSLDL